MSGDKTVLASVADAMLFNVGNTQLVIVDGSDTYAVDNGAVETIYPASSDILIQSNSKTIATVAYKDASSVTITRGTQVPGTRFEIKVRLRA